MSNPALFWAGDGTWKPGGGPTPTRPTFSYLTGDQTGTITVTQSGGLLNGSPENLVNGNLTEQTQFFNVVTLTGAQYLQFDFGTPTVINGAKFYDSGGATAQGTWKWQGSADGSSFTDIGASFSLAGGSPSPAILTSMADNVTAYRYYRLVGLSGATNQGPWIYEFQFSVGTISKVYADVSNQPGDDVVYLEDFAPGTGPVADWTPIVQAAMASFPTQVVNTTSYKGRILFTHRPGQASRRALTGGVYNFLTPARSGSTFAIEVNGQVTLEGMGNPGLNAFGVSSLVFAQGLSGIACYYTDYPTPGSTDATGAYIKGLALTGYSKTDTAPTTGLWFNTTIVVERVDIQFFGSHGLQSAADAIVGTSSSSLSYITNVDSNSNGGDGFHAAGGDANGILFLNCKARNNGGWGFYDDSFLGNHWVGGQVASNALGGVHATKPGASAVFLGVYSEADQIHLINTPSTVIGGYLGFACAIGRNQGNAGILAGNAMSSALIRNVVTPGSWAGGITGELPAVTPVLSPGELGLGNVGNNDPTVFIQLRDYNESGGIWPFRLKRGTGGFFWDWANAGTNNALMRFYNTQATVANGYSRDMATLPPFTNPGGIGFEQGIILGRNQKYVGYASAMPGTTTGYVVGDILFNEGPTAGSTVGWNLTPSGWRTFGAKAFVDVRDFGYVPDAVINGSYVLVSGTDMQPAVQAAIDYALQNRIPKVCVPTGAARMGSTLHLGHGDGFGSVHLEGVASAAYPDLPGVIWAFDNTDRPGLNVQGARSSRVSNIAFLGKNYTWITNNRVGTVNHLNAVPGDWLDPALTPTGNNPGGLQQHSPYAALTIDAFKGTAPTDAYAGTYGKAASSNVSIENCTFLGFGIGVCGSPNGDGNGDFIYIKNCSFSYCVYGAAICNTQARNNVMQDCSFLGVHTWITTTKFGLGLGLWGGPITNCNGSSCYQMVDWGGGSSMGTTIKNSYMEIGVRVGSFGPSGGVSAGSVTIEAMHWGSSEELHGTAPDALIIAPSNMCITLDNCTINNTTSRLVPLLAGGASLVIKGGNYYGTHARLSGATFGSAAFQRAINFSGGIALPVHDSFAHTTSQSSVEWIGDVTASYMVNPTDTTAGGQLLSKRQNWAGGIRTQMQQSAIQIPDAVGGVWNILYKGNQVSADLSDAGTFPTAPSLSGDVLTFSIATSQYVNVSSYHLLPGDFVFHLGSKTLFIVTTVGAVSGGAYPITALQQNNMEINTTTLAMATQNMSDPTFTAKQFIFQSCGPMLMQQVSYGTFTALSTAVSNVSRGDGYGGNTSAFYSTGDLFISFPYVGATNADKWPINGISALGGVTNGSPGSMVLGAQAVMSGDFPIYPLPISR